MTALKAPAAAGLLLLAAGCAQLPGAGGLAGGGGAADACGAAERQALVGTSVGALDPATLPEPNRVIFPGQAVTMDFVVERLNVEIDADDEVARVFCG